MKSARTNIDAAPVRVHPKHGPLYDSAPHVPLTPGDMIRHVRTLQGLTQAALAKTAGLTQATVSGLESGAITLGLERAKKLAAALQVHPAVLAFPDWKAPRATAA